ncbi:PREDICTED: regulator of telomere elongation helicase 1 homolog [Polistes canadensis]|uniref:regulator of telomere elongation helicase 1 homolog n=1 Tax=Polistes canadensis TaxID=91411 RepID=UPI000718D947|nr:PREDICTED: regulator of telomere elongation helicase 1 homolog [Polistes canadensis]
MSDITINGIVINFPFKPYPVQEEYMAKVIECLQNSKHGVLESPTGTGKTLCLLCSSLSWLITKKAQLQAEAMVGAIERSDLSGHFFNKISKGLEKAAGVPDNSASFGWAMPKIIYASRTHSQLSQAMKELKRTTYKHVQVSVLGSRDQLCIHPEVSKETNSYNKVQMCQAKVKSKTCFYYCNVEKRKGESLFKQEILDIEDLVSAGQKMNCCPYYLAKELNQNADITFMPYNYLLDSKTRRMQGIEVQNNVILLDEAHNVEKVCEEAASLQISSTDIAMCIDEITAVMTNISTENKDNESEIDFLSQDSINVQKDFTPEDLCILKTMFLELEKAIDDIKITKQDEGDTLPGGYIFELLSKAELTHRKTDIVIEKLEKIVSYLVTTNTSPFARKGNALQKFINVLRVLFSSGNSLQHREKIEQCYKVYIQLEEQKKNQKSDGWQTKKIALKNEGKVINYWCFSPGFSIQQLVDQGIRSVILTSGTLSPLKPFILELGIPIDVQLENPHIITGQQVCIGVLSQGPDGHELNSSFNTRNNPKYIASLGRTIYNFSCLIPHGLLVFFPSYPIMQKCKDDWQFSGLWTQISESKTIYVEPRSKDGFINIMHEYYQKIQDPTCKGAIFMAVCRGKVSEGLDFANANGRAVLITGLPFPPMKDPRVMLKQKYLEEMRRKDTQVLTGQQWYQLEASRAVNQAIGRIIRHKTDYGAIILCDCRFENPHFKQQLSAWLRPHIKKFSNFGMITRELRNFFRYTQQAFPQPKMSISQNSSTLSLPAVPCSFDTTSSRSIKRSISNTNTNTKVESTIKETFSIDQYIDNTVKKRSNDKAETESIFSKFASTSKKSVINFSHCKLEKSSNNCTLVEDSPIEHVVKKRKIKIISTKYDADLPGPSTSNHEEVNNLDEFQKKTDESNKELDKREMGKAYIKKVKKSLTEEKYQIFGRIIKEYTATGNLNDLLQTLEYLFSLKGELQHLFIGFKTFLKKKHVEEFDEYIKKMNK